MLHYHQDSETTSVVIFRKPASVGEGSSRILVPVVSNCRLRTTHYLTLTMWKEFLLLFLCCWIASDATRQKWKNRQGRKLFGLFHVCRPIDLIEENGDRCWWSQQGHLADRRVDDTIAPKSIQPHLSTKNECTRRNYRFIFLLPALECTRRNYQFIFLLPALERKNSMHQDENSVRTHRSDRTDIYSFLLHILSHT